MVSQKSLGVWPLSLLRNPFSVELLEAALAMVHCLELGGFTFRGTDLLALVGNQWVPYCLSIVERLSLFQSLFREVPLHIFL